VSDVKVAMQSRLLRYSNTTATAARLHHIAEMLIAWGDSVTWEILSHWLRRLCHKGGRLRHGVGDIYMAGETL